MLQQNPDPVYTSLHFKAAIERHEGLIILTRESVCETYDMWKSCVRTLQLLDMRGNQWAVQLLRGWNHLVSLSNKSREYKRTVASVKYGRDVPHKIWHGRVTTLDLGPNCQDSSSESNKPTCKKTQHKTFSLRESKVIFTIYFAKVELFCFSENQLEANQGGPS